MSVFGQVFSPDRDGYRTSTPNLICWEHTAKRYLEIVMVIRHQLDRFSGNLTMETEYTGKVGHGTEKSCRSESFVQAMELLPSTDNECKKEFSSKYEGLVSYGVAPTIIPIANYFSKWKKSSQLLKDPVKFCKRVKRRTGWDIAGGAGQGTFTESGWSFTTICQEAWLLEGWKWTPLVFDAGQTVWEAKQTFKFEVTCPNTRCWDCPKKHTVSFTVTPPPCEGKEESKTFSGNYEIEMSNDVWKNSPHFVQLDEYTDETGPYLPTITGFGGRIFGHGGDPKEGSMKQKIDEAIAGLEDIQTCADLPDWDASLTQMYEAWSDKVGS